MVEKHSVTVTTDGSGNGSAVTRAFNGRVVAVRYAKVDFSNGVDFTITNTTTGQGIWTQTDVNASDVVYPMQLADDLVGSALTAIYQPVYLADETITIAVAQGGSAHTGTFTVYVER